MNKEELMDRTDSAIAELVRDNAKLLKAYNYYNGIRDAELFRFLEENFGLKSPTSVEFTPLIKKHIDALIGEFLGTPILPKITCKDSATINNINREKQLHIVSEVQKFLSDKVNNALLEFIGKGQTLDVNIKQQLDKLIATIESDFTSEYEIAAQNVVEYIMQSRQTDFITKLRFLLLDLLVAGYALFRATPSVSGSNVALEVLDPRNTFLDRNPESIYVRDSYRAVIRKWMSKLQILNKYGKDLSKEDLHSIKDEWHFQSQGSYYVEGRPGDKFPPANGDLDNGITVEMGYPFEDRINNTLIPVYEVEWTETDSEFVMHRYTTIRISDGIYILNGEDENTIRSKDNPSYCGLSINGIYFTNRSHKPYSLMLACCALLDKYDLLLYLRDNLLANAGTVGDYLDMAMLPTWLGTGPAERIQKYIAYKKQGIALLDTALEGRLATGQAPMNTLVNGFDDTVKAPAIQAILMAIDSLELTTSSITGVFRERLNGIEQRDAVTNVKLGAANSYIITKLYYQLMDILTSELLLDALNVAKVVYSKGLTGTIVLGEKYQKIFTALPKYFTITDHDIHVTTSTLIMQDLETIKSLIPELLKSQQIDPQIVFEALTAKSVTELKLMAVVAMRKAKEENNQLQQLAQQVEQLQLQLQESQKNLETALKKIETLNEQKLQIESQKMQSDAKIAWYQAQTDRTYKTQEAEIDKRKVEIEYLLLSDGNPYNDKVNFNK